MSLKNLTEQEFAALVKRRDTDAIDAAVPRGGQRPQGPGPANHVKSASKYRSKWEAAYASKLELEQRAGLIKQYWYEPFSLWLPGKVRYKPDFLVEYAYVPGMKTDLEIIEVKGWSKNRRDGMTRLKMAAALFPCFTWKLVTREKGQWDERTIA